MKDTPYAKQGLARLVAAAGNSLAGLRAAWRCEAAFRQETALVAILLPIALLLPVTMPERLLLIASLFVVLIVELLNSAVEAAIDRISLDRHELSARAKDIGSAAVMLSLLLAAVIWGAIVLPLLLSWRV